MIAELIMATYGWTAVWAPGVGNPENPVSAEKGHRPLHTFKSCGFLVGVWTGPDKDLLCVRRTDWMPDAERYKSPHGRTILDAVLRGLVVRICGDIASYLQDYMRRRMKREQKATGRGHEI